MSPNPQTPLSYRAASEHAISGLARGISRSFFWGLGAWVFGVMRRYVKSISIP